MAPWMRSNHRQEHKTRTLLNWKGKPIVHWVDYMMAMVYDNANDPNGHSTFDFATSSLYNAQNALGGKIGPYWPRFCLGLPFYARKRDDSSWRSYEDIIQPQHTAVADNVIADGVRDDFYDDGGVWTFNSVSTIEKKSRWAIENGAGGLMIWEIGQDCRVSHNYRPCVSLFLLPSASLFVRIYSTFLPFTSSFIVLDRPYRALWACGTRGDLPRGPPKLPPRGRHKGSNCCGRAPRAEG